MDFSTITQLSLDCETIVNEGDKIAIYFKSGEILHGYYTYSDCSSLNIERNCDEFYFDFDEINYIEILERCKD